ncbi:thioesterase [Amycolatopsis suaedae]|uniref:Thioesterase n=1 Tax=Amycolatopsis suaedae TaxID=2510978 RepID=A0A4Q7J1I3_9PSEU|nr:thioesterase [Amycolatopsis suaedae]
MRDIQADKWIRRYRPTGDAPVRLVCLPHAGGSASFYYPVALAHSGAADVVVLQYPGRQDRRHEPCPASIEEYADLVHAVLAPEPALPTVLFGHSMGAVIGFEVVRRMERDGTGDAVRLIASGRRGPSSPLRENVHQRDDDGIVAELRSLNGTDLTRLGDDEILRMTLPAIRSDYRAIETYTCAEDVTVACPVTVLVGSADPRTPLAEAARWRRHTTGEYRLEEFPGGHFYLTGQQDAVNREIAAELAALRR